jgi:ABC-type Zn uptake system ZnuABC Zn-binding protein ZnuA
LGFAVGARAQAPAADKPLIAVTIHPLADLVSQLVGESARVLTVVPPGASSHGMELPPATLAALANARLYIAIGKGIDHRLSQGVARALPGLPRIDAIDWVARQAPQPQQPLPQAPVTDKPAPGQPEPAHPKNAQHPGHPEHSEHGRHAEQTAPTPASSDRRASDHPADPKLAPAKENKHDRDPVHDPEHDHEHAPGQGDASRAANPHVWLDPVWARRFVASITPRLVEVLPGDRAGLEARSRQLDQRLADLHTEYSKALGSLAMRKLITYHDAFDVLAARYDLQVVGYIEPLVELRPGGELTPGRIVEIAKLVGGLGVPTLYYEPQFPRSAVDAIAARAGVGVMKLDPLGHPRVPGYEGYFQMMRSNLATLVKGQSASPKR